MTGAHVFAILTFSVFPELLKIGKRAEKNVAATKIHAHGFPLLCESYNVVAEY